MTKDKQKGQSDCSVLFVLLKEDVVYFIPSFVLIVAGIAFL